MAFRAFDLTSRRDHRGRVLPRASHEDLQRLAKCFNVPYDQLSAEFEDFVPDVIQRFTSSGNAGSWRSAWTEAVKH
eukprot:127824-Pyramimonas_sp.AAC.1